MEGNGKPWRASRCVLPFGPQSKRIIGAIAVVNFPTQHVILQIPPLNYLGKAQGWYRWPQTHGLYTNELHAANRNCVKRRLLCVHI